jgi:hypothetical protein
MRNLLIKLFLFIFCITLSGSMYAQDLSGYKKQISYLIKSQSEIGQEFKFRFKDKDNNTLDVKFSASDSVNWKITIMNDTILVNKYSYPFEAIHHIGLVKPGKSEQTCILVVSATGGNMITTNEFTFINPDFDSLMIVQINYLEKNGNTSYNYNKSALNPYRMDETKFLVGLLGEYDKINYKNFRQKK